MPLDAVCLTALTRELAPRVTGAKIDKIQMPARDMILLGLRGAGETLRLLLSAGTGSARAHITTASFENPASPPMFCMLLRKHLNGGRICGLTQPPMERLLILEVDAPDELGVISRKRLVLEMMGRSTNLILVGSDGRVLDCLRRVGPEQNEARPLLPGLVYRVPPAQDRPCLFTLDPAERRALIETAPAEAVPERWLSETFSGLSPLLIRELCHRAGCMGRAASIADARQALQRETEALCGLVSDERFMPVLLTEQGRPRDYSFMPIGQYGNAVESETFSDFSSLLDAFHTRRDKAETMRRRAQELTRAAKTSRDRLLRKLDAQERELRATADREKYRRRGDLITANLWQLRRGMDSFMAVDYYEEGCPEVRVTLDVKKSPQENAAACYKAYKKAATAEKILTEQIASARADAAYLDSVLDELARAEADRDLTEIRQELIEGGFLRRDRTEKKRAKTPRSGPLRFVSDSGFQILVGRSNLQNDELTLRTARRTDMWLHTQKVHGSHVIISCEGREPDEETLMQAASLAAYYSQSREGGRVAVDYTQVRFVKKPSGARPGMVIYTDYKTLFAVPDASLAERLAVR
ncbi:MAG: NFACT RNA binding domain-containing protein [Eubacteriales bacterium]|nr:NFACT RNA binding domain-containing protein [Eubacteriales bacterium]